MGDTEALYDFWKVSVYLCLFLGLYASFGLLVPCLITLPFIYLTDGFKDLDYMRMIVSCELKKIWFTFRYLVPSIERSKKKKASEIFLETARRNPKKKALICAESGRCLTYEEMHVLVNKTGFVFQKAGYVAGDNIALFVENELEYTAIWMGLNQIGIVVALVNINLHGKSLEHCLTIVNFKAIICSNSLIEKLQAIGFVDKNDIEVFTVGRGDEVSETANTKDLLKVLSEEQSTVSPRIYEHDMQDTALCIYTSGSTGRPKAAKMTHKKTTQLFSGFGAILQLCDTDVVYNCLPLYHASGGLIFIAPMAFNGCTVIIRKKFSASNFISDCIKYNVTVVGYIGELWRYLLARSPQQTDKTHKIRLAMGNGLRKNLFREVQSRFGVQQIIEFYGATEGNIGFFNNDNTPGAVGYIYSIFRFLNMGAIMKVDVETGELVRDTNGMGIVCKSNEVGMMVGLINDKMRYDGYQNNERESNKKVASNVFSKGDKVFLTGDLLTKDEYNYIYFVDRIGDTFRWKSENVSTTEIENIMSSLITTAEDVVVYPIPIKDQIGNAGMAYIRMRHDQSFSPTGLVKSLLEEVPKYALPMFLRVGTGLDQTSTLKYQKSNLKKVGYNLESCDADDTLYVFDVTKNDYVILDLELLKKIENGEMRF